MVELKLNHTSTNDILTYGHLDPKDIKTYESLVESMVNRFVLLVRGEAVFFKHLDGCVNNECLCLEGTSDTGHSTYTNGYRKRVTRTGVKPTYAEMTKQERKYAVDELFATVSGVNEYNLRKKYGKDIDFETFLSEANVKQRSAGHDITCSGLAILLIPNLKLKNIKGLKNV
jgi:hypothetical protein